MARKISESRLRSVIKLRIERSCERTRYLKAGFNPCSG